MKRVYSVLCILPHLNHCTQTDCGATDGDIKFAGQPLPLVAPELFAPTIKIPTSRFEVAKHHKTIPEGRPFHYLHRVNKPASQAVPAQYRNHVDHSGQGMLHSPRAWAAAFEDGGLTMDGCNRQIKEIETEVCLPSPHPQQRRPGS